MIEDTAEEQILLNESALDYIIGLRKMQKTDLHLDDYGCELNVTAAERDGEETARILFPSVSLPEAFPWMNREMNAGYGMEQKTILPPGSGWITFMPTLPEIREMGWRLQPIFPIIMGRRGT